MSESLIATFLNVGQGDSTLIRLPHEVNSTISGILIDCPSGQSPLVINAIKSRNITHLALVVVTHSDDDHCGGISDILAGFSSFGTALPDFPEQSLDVVVLPPPWIGAMMGAG
jgi:competence protein ComEC